MLIDRTAEGIKADTQRQLSEEEVGREATARVPLGRPAPRLLTTYRDGRAATARRWCRHWRRIPGWSRRHSGP
jgi:hypothetical protein